MKMMEQFMELSKLVLALVMFMSANVLFGAQIASLKLEFDKTVLVNGIKKHAATAIGIVMMYIGGLFLPNQTFDVLGAQLTVVDALNVLFTLAIALYVGKATKNLAILLGVSSSNKEEAVVDVAAPQVTELDESVG